MTTEAGGTPLTQDQVLAQLRTRGFEEGFVRTTLRDFVGTLTDFGGVMREGDRGAYMVVLYNFNELEVIEATEPYESPIGQLEMPASSRAKSAMGYLGASIDRIINPNIPADVTQDQPTVKNQDFLIGKRCHMKFTPGHLIPKRQTDGSWEDIPNSCWELIEIVGEGAAPAVTATVTPPAPPKPGDPPITPVATPAQAGLSASQQAIALLDGKTEPQWHQVVFTDPIVKANADVVNSIIGRTFLTPFVEAGTVSLDENQIYHVKK